jgi:hypothetical protein
LAKLILPTAAEWPLCANEHAVLEKPLPSSLSVYRVRLKPQSDFTGPPLAEEADHTKVSDSCPSV